MLEKTNLQYFEITLGDRGIPQTISNFEQFRDNQMFLDRLKDDLSRQRKFGCYRDWELNETKAALTLLLCELKRPECHVVSSGDWKRRIRKETLSALDPDCVKTRMPRYSTQQSDPQEEVGESIGRFRRLKIVFTQSGSA